MKKFLIWERDDTSPIHAEGETLEEAKSTWVKALLDGGDFAIGTLEDWKNELRGAGLSEKEIKECMEENGMK